MMYLSAVFSITSLLALSVAGLPVRRHNASSSKSSSPSSSDVLVLQFADVLEQFENQFYTQALQKFQVQDFINAGFIDADVPIQQFKSIMGDESTHAGVLEAVLKSLNQQPITGCSFNFDVALQSVSTMAPIARIVENTGVGAYLGAAHLIKDPVILTAAASIVTVEARHQTILNVLNGGTAIPAAFDLPLAPQEVLAIAGGFIQGCSIPGITALEALAITNNGTVAAGTSLTFTSNTLSKAADTKGLSCQMLAGGLSQALTFPLDQCVVPSNVTGPVAIYVTNSSQPLSGSVQDRALDSIVAGPTMVILDGPPEALSSLALKGTDSNANATGCSCSSPPPPSGNSNITTTSPPPSGVQTTPPSGSTQTITPDQASSIISGSSPISATSTGYAPGSTSTGAAAPGGSQSPGGNGVTGPSADGSLNVTGVTFVPNPN